MIISYSLIQEAFFPGQTSVGVIDIPVGRLVVVFFFNGPSPFIIGVADPSAVSIVRIGQKAVMGQIRIGRKHLASHIGGGLVPVSVIIYRISKTVVGDGGQLVSRIAIGGCDDFCAIDGGYLSQPVVIGIIRVIDCVSQRVGFRCQQTVSRVIGVGSSSAAGVCDGTDISSVRSIRGRRGHTFCSSPLYLGLDWIPITVIGISIIHTFGAFS